MTREERIEKTAQAMVDHWYDDTPILPLLTELRSALAAPPPVESAPPLGGPAQDYRTLAYRVRILATSTPAGLPRAPGPLWEVWDAEFDALDDAERKERAVPSGHPPAAAPEWAPEERCPTCHGRNWYDPCPACGRSGGERAPEECQTCKGKGWIPDGDVRGGKAKCFDCKGSGRSGGAPEDRRCTAGKVGCPGTTCYVDPGILGCSVCGGRSGGAGGGK